MLSYIATGLVGAIIYARRGSIEWSMAWWVCTGALPGAYLGSVVIAYTPAVVLELIIALLIIFAGIDAFRRQPDEAVSTYPNNLVLFVVGFIVGVCSSMSGTGGPLVLVPILIWMKLPILMAVGLSQIIQLPISILATIGNLIHGHVDFALGIGIAVLMIFGVVIGARLAHIVQATLLKRIIAIFLVIVGAGVTLKIGSRAFETMLY